MAFVHKKRNANVRRRVLFKLGAAGCTLLPCALAVWYIALLLTKKEPPASMGCVVLMVAGVCALAVRWMRTRAAVLQSGLSGERRTVPILRTLPNEYHILVNPVLTVRGQTAELDAVAIGKNGVFIVETKNHTGVITGKTDAEWWSQKKRSGAKSMKNPLLQLERQHRVVTRALADAGLGGCPVRAYVCFANPNARVNVRDERIYVNPDALRRAIRNAPRPFSSVDVRQVLAALEDACE